MDGTMLRTNCLCNWCICMELKSGPRYLRSWRKDYQAWDKTPNNAENDGGIISIPTLIKVRGPYRKSGSSVISTGSMGINGLRLLNSWWEGQTTKWRTTSTALLERTLGKYKRKSYPTTKREVSCIRFWSSYRYHPQELIHLHGRVHRQLL